MKRRFINALTLSGVAVLGLVGLVGCGQKSVSAISISNKEELGKDWKYGEAARTLSFTFEGLEVDAATAIKEGSLKVVSSDAEIIAVSGSTLTTTGVGSATITATYTNSGENGTSVTDSVSLKVLASKAEVTSLTVSNKLELQEEWKKGEANRQLQFDFGGVEINAGQAIKNGALKIESDNPEVVSTIGSYISPVGIGSATITASYTNQKESGSDRVVTDSFKVVVTENASEQAAKVVTLKEFKELTISTDSDGNLVNKELYQVTGKIKGFGSKEASLSENPSDAGQYGNMFLEDEEGTSLQIYGSTCTNTALTFADGKWKFTNPKDFSSSEFGQSLKVGDEVTMLLIRCDYKTAIEGCGRFVSGPSLIDATEVDFADVVNDSNVTASAKLFTSTAVIKGFGSKEDSLSEEASQAGAYGNLFVTDLNGKNSIYVYGATAGEGAISWTGSKFKFTNPKDFKTNEVTSTLKVGDKIKFVGIRADYNGTKEICIQSVTKVSE